MRLLGVVREVARGGEHEAPTLEFRAFPLLRTERIELCEYDARDVDDILAVRSDAEVQQYNWAPHDSKADTPRFIQSNGRLRADRKAFFEQLALIRLQVRPIKAGATTLSAPLAIIANASGYFRHARPAASLCPAVDSHKPSDSVQNLRVESKPRSAYKRRSSTSPR